MKRILLSLGFVFGLLLFVAKQHYKRDSWKSFQTHKAFCWRFILPIVLLTWAIPSLRAQEIANVEIKAASVKDSVEIFLKLAEKSRGVNPQNAVTYSLKALDLAKAEDVDQFIGRCYLNSSVYHWETDAYQVSLKYLDSAQHYYKARKDTVFIAKCHGMRGIYELYEGNNKLAIRYLTEALSTLESFSAKDKKIYTFISDNYHNVGMVYNNMKQYRRAITFYLKSIDATIKSKDTFQIEMTYSSIGLAYHELNIPDSAFLFFNKALKWDNPNHLGGIYHNIGYTYHSIDSLDKAIAYYEKSYAIRKEIQDKRGLALLSNELAVYYLNNNELNRANFHIEEGMKYAKELTLTEDLGPLIKSKALYLEKTGQYKKALATYQDYHLLYESILNDKNLAAIEEISVEYETEKKDQQLDLQARQLTFSEEEMARQKWQLITVVIILVLLSVLFVVIISLWKQAQKNKNLQEQLNRQMEHNVVGNLTEIRSSLELRAQESGDEQLQSVLHAVDRMIANLQLIQKSIGDNGQVELSAFLNKKLANYLDMLDRNHITTKVNIAQVKVNTKIAKIIAGQTHLKIEYFFSKFLIKSRFESSLSF